VKDAGGSVLIEPFEVTDAGRMSVLSDPAGAGFCVWHAKGHKGAQLVNEPGTCNWSDFNTRDTEAAKAFYGRDREARRGARWRGRDAAHRHALGPGREAARSLGAAFTFGKFQPPQEAAAPMAPDREHRL
jgi:hypothetical protein